MGKILKSSEYKDKLDLKSRVEFEDRPSRVVERAKPSNVGVLSKELMTAQDEAEAILEEARQEAAEIRQDARQVLAQVKDEMEKSRQKGEEQGYQEGLERALEYMQKLHVLKEKWFQNFEPQIVQMVFTMVERIIGKLAQENSSVILGVIHQALDAAMGQKLTIHVSPEDYQTVKENEAILLARVTGLKTVFFEEDANVSRGGCLVESEVGAIDAQLITQLNAMKKALGVENESSKPHEFDDEEESDFT